MNKRELELAKKAASKFLYKKPDAIAKEIPKVPLPPIKKKSTGVVKNLNARFMQANAAYEENKKYGATMESIEVQFGLNKKSLKNWRSYRIVKGDSAVKRINKNMKRYEDQVVKEKAELDEKADKLSNFMKTDAFKNLDPEDMTHLKLQLCAMDIYSGVLGMRILRFKNE